MELRDRAVRAYEAGEGGYAAIGARFGVAAASVLRWVRLSIAQGTTQPLAKAGGNRSAITGEEISALLRQLGDPTAGELTAAYNHGRRGTARIHVSSMKRALHRHGYVVKKSADGRWRVSDRT